jgi:hypothetical protein
MKKFLKSAFLASVMSLAGIAAAHASSAAWSNQVNEPLIYQTNFTEGPSNVPALSGTPSTGLISTVSWAWGYNASTYGADPAYTLEAKICIGTFCGFNNAGNKVGTSVTGTTYYSGKPANSTFKFYVTANSSVTKAFVSALNPSRQFAITVNYTY